MKRWMIGLLIAALMAGMTCGFAEEGAPAPEPEPAPAAEAAPAPEPEPTPTPTPAPAPEAPKEAPKEEKKEEPKEEPKEKKEEEPKEEPKAEKKEEPKAEAKPEEKTESRVEEKVEAKPEAKEEPKSEEAPETKKEPETKEEPKAEAKPEAVTETKAEPKAENAEGDENESVEESGEEVSEEVTAEAQEETEPGNAPEEEPGDAPEGETSEDEALTEAIEADDVEVVQDDAAAESTDPDNTQNGNGNGDGSDNNNDNGNDNNGTVTDPQTPPTEDGQPEVTEGEGPDFPVEAGDEENAEKQSATVTQIQQWLAALGYLSGDQVTGVYDSPTIRAVKRFQGDNGLTATGKCTGDTYDLLKAKATGTYVESTPTPEPTATPEPTTPSEVVETPPETPENPDTPQQDQNVKRGKMPGKGGFGGGRGGSGGGRSGGAGGGAAGEGEVEDDGLNGVTPGEALSATHSSGDRDDTLYGAMDIEADLYALDFEADGGEPYEYEYVIDAGRLTLSGGSRWTFTGKSLRALNRSGVRQLVLAGSRGVTLDTAQRFTGAAYEALRARGYTDNTFEYDIDTASGEIAVIAGGGRYLLGADGALIPAED